MAIVTSGRVRTLMGVALAAVTVLVATACTSGGSDAAPELENPTLRVGYIPLIDDAPLFIGQSKGIWKKHGINLEPVALSNDQEVITQLKNGTLDVAIASYVTMFKAAANGTELEIEGEAYQAAKNTIALVNLPDGRSKTLKDVARPTILVSSIEDVDTLTTRSALQTIGVTDINFVVSPFEQMGQQLQDKKADAAWIVEPYLTQAQQILGANILLDTARGATQDFPISGYVSSKKYANENRQKLEQFRKALSESQGLAANPLTVQQVLPEFIKQIDVSTASLVNIGRFPTTLNAIRLQRVANLMDTSNMIPGALQVSKLMPPGYAAS
ncbi:ABC transporter substrate-binding protein [Pseudonocardiaceae bacterium YIM PH 21723]|nr:ABC transporter substrate-binding protein [Pseudonocardiaceae bacterium YIM PH 21723]